MEERLERLDGPPMSRTLARQRRSPLVGVQDEEQLVLTEVLRHAERLDLRKAVAQHLANARLRDGRRG